MCGIAGIVSLSPAVAIPADALATMAAQLVHRGPDDAGQYVDPQGRCGLAFRRLAIIDRAGGHQPMPNEDRTIWVVFNGEIYNFRELRQQLRTRGHVFATQADTEVIIHLYEEHGPDCLEHLAGMFAIALWDERRGRLLLARDRFGKKPLLYVVHQERLYFASEAKAILALPGVPRELDPQSLHRYLIFQYVPAPHSIYRGFRKLLPAHRLTVAAGEPLNDNQTPYWRLTVSRFAGRFEDAQKRLEELLRAAVARRLIADVPLGAFLSGGIDSSSVVALMRELGVSPLRTFTIAFAERRYNEAAYGRLVAQHFQTEHHEHLVTPQARELLDTLAWHYDEPFADSSAIPTCYVSRWSRQCVTVALTGDGGDECFAGYDRYRAARLAGNLEWVPQGLRRGLAAAAALWPHQRPRTLANRLHRFLTVLGRRPAQRYLAWVNVFPPELLAVGYRDEFRALIDWNEPVTWFENLYDQVRGNPADRAVMADWLSYLPYDLLTKVDLASMACSLECRSPFLDHELVEFALSLPLSWRLGKHILKQWARPRLPPEVLRRPKMGFGVPVGQWLRNELQDLLRGKLLAGDSLSQRVFRPAWLRTLVEAHISGRANHEHQLWALLMLELWCERWQPAGPPLP